MAGWVWSLLVFVLLGLVFAGIAVRDHRTMQSGRPGIVLWRSGPAGRFQKSRDQFDELGAKAEE